MTGQAYDTAVQLAGRLLGGQAQRWERFVYLFAQVRGVWCVVGGGWKYQPKLNQNQRKRECRQRR